MEKLYDEDLEAYGCEIPEMFDCDRAIEALTDIGRIVSIVKDEFEKSLRKVVEQCKI